MLQGVAAVVGQELLQQQRMLLAWMCPSWPQLQQQQQRVPVMSQWKAGMICPWPWVTTITSSSSTCSRPPSLPPLSRRR